MKKVLLIIAIVSLAYIQVSNAAKACGGYDDVEIMQYELNGL